MPVKLTKKYSIQDIANAIDRDKTTIIKWEKNGTIPSAKRDEHGWRYYSEEEVQNIISLAEKMKLKVLKKQKTKSISRASRQKQGKSVLTQDTNVTILQNKRLRKELIKHIQTDKELQKQVIKLLVKSLTKKKN